MDLSGDDLAGVVDLFGAMAHAELADALAELAFRHGVDPPDDDIVEAAVDAYQLVEYDRDGRTLLAVGPAAFPTLPEGADDLPHILDLEPRDLDRRALGTAVESRFRGEAARAVDRGDAERIADLLDVSYELEAWGPVDLGGARKRLDAAEPTN